MQTRFTARQLETAVVAASEPILRKCVHCGFCTATCPTYVLLGDELDSPRGRIYLIKDMLENDQPATAGVVKHIDRCLSCLSCMTTCPSGVHFQHLIDHARVHVERTYRRPFAERWLRAHPARDPGWLLAASEHPDAAEAARLKRESCDVVASRVCRDAWVDGYRLRADFYLGDRAMRESGFDVNFHFGPFAGA